MMKNLITIVLVGGAVLLAQKVGPKTFASPQEGRDAILEAATQGPDALKALFGPGATEILRTGDKVQDHNLLKQFVQRAAEKTQLETDQMDPNRVTLLIGTEEWPFAVPLLRKNGRWYFDVREGAAEVRRRVIGGNELNAIEICLGYVEAQKRYAETDWNGNGVLEYAAKLSSTEGKKDGLYWRGEDSPVAAGFAKAAAEGYSLGKSTQSPYHGYYYKVLPAQGPQAPGGARDFVVRGLMIGGFALVAWPAEYMVSGVKTFIVNQDGIVYEKDLGRNTAALVKAMTSFNPDSTWDIPPEPES